MATCVAYQHIKVHDGLQTPSVSEVHVTLEHPSPSHLLPHSLSAWLPFSLSELPILLVTLLFLL